MRKIVVLLVLTFILTTIIMLVNLNVPEEESLNTIIVDEDLIVALKIEELEQSIATIPTETTIKFKVKKNEISASGYFTYNESHIYITAIGEYKTYVADGLVNYYRATLYGEMELDGEKWDIEIGYSDYDSKVKYVILVNPTVPSELYTNFRFNWYQFEPGFLDKYRLIESD